ncbi:MAG: hypothetical protein CM1200mP28_07940 [Deltaproteobacteria bacterium]|nr:MAG: hypothetical protein CM1200mP28_07940 [Deltaproteobacteria bacterium]
MEDLKATIKDINIESRRRFKEMFDQVNENFQSVFSTLFEGGKLNFYYRIRGSSECRR